MNAAPTLRDAIAADLDDVRALAGRLVAEAKGAGYGAMRLDTMPGRMGPANALYESLGFRDIPAYYANPIPDVRYMELDLTA